MHVSDEKESLRHSVQERIAHLSEKEKSAEGRTLCRHLLTHIPKGSTVCAYYPMKSEADIHLLLEELLLRGDTVFLPCFENSTLIFRQVLDFDHLRKGALGVLEPTQDEPVLTSGEGDIVLVPGRAFDRTGNRMGRGNGGYDKWIRKQRKMNPETLFVGIALECQLVGSVPTEPHDEPIDAIATARGLVDAVKEI